MSESKCAEDFEITNDELHKISKALKNEQFRNLLSEYVEEVNSPESKKNYKEEIKQLELERGFDVTFIDPEPGYVIKTSVNGEKKTFINICSNPNVQKIDCNYSRKSNKNDQVSKHGFNISAPHTLAPPRKDYDNSRKECVVYDVVFHPTTLKLTSKNRKFCKIINDIAIDSVEKNFKVKLDRNNIKFPKLKFKGRSNATVIRRRIAEELGHGSEDLNIPNPYPPCTNKFNSEINSNSGEFSSNNASTNVNEQQLNSATIPKYCITFREYVDIQDTVNTRSVHYKRPKEILIAIELPLLNSAAGINLDIFEKQLLLKSSKPFYYLDISLPFAVFEDQGSAQFDKCKRKLIVSLVVRPINSNAVLSLNDLEEECASHEESTKVEVTNEMEDCNHQNLDKDNEPEQSMISLCQSSDHKMDSEKKKSYLPNIEIECKRTQYLLPPYDVDQDDETISVVFYVKNIDPQTIKQCPDKYSYNVTFTSIGEGFFPNHYSFQISFPCEYNLDCEDCFLDTNEENAVLMLNKSESCQTLWDFYYVGLNTSCLKKEHFITLSNLDKQLKILEGTSKSIGTSGQSSEVKVLSMDENQLVLEVQVNKNVFQNENLNNKKEILENQDNVSSPMNNNMIKPESSELHKEIEMTELKNLILEISEADAEIRNKTTGQRDEKPFPYRTKTTLHSKSRTISESSDDMDFALPMKRGILKHRTISESSDDFSYSSCDGWCTVSNGSCSPEIVSSSFDSDVYDEANKAKKCVRFNDKVCQTTYKVNSTVLGQRRRKHFISYNKKYNRSKGSSSERIITRSEPKSGGDNEVSIDNSSMNFTKESNNNDEFKVPFENICDESKNKTGNIRKRNRKRKSRKLYQYETNSEIIIDNDNKMDSKMGFGTKSNPSMSNGLVFALDTD